MSEKTKQNTKSATELIAQAQKEFEIVNQRLGGTATKFEQQRKFIHDSAKVAEFDKETRKNGPHDSLLGFTYDETLKERTIHSNPRPFNFVQSVTSVNPTAYTYKENPVERMMRDPSEIDPGLVTGPIPDPTFMSRMPTFDHAPEQIANDRWRMQRNGAMRFW